jgi:hypothetical protein
MGLSWASPKNSKSKSTSTSNDRGRYRTYSAPLPKKKTPKPTPKAKKPNQNNNQRANLPSEVSKPVRPATPVRSTAKTTPVASAKITQGGEDRPSGSLKSGLITKAIAAPVANVIKPIAQSKTSQDPKLLREMGIGANTPKAKTASSAPTAIKPASKANPFGGAAMASIMSDSDPATRNMSLLQGYQNTPTSRDNFDKSSYDKKAASSKDSIMPTVSDKYRNDEVSYNQAYWKAKLDGGASQAEMAAEQKALGSKKTYSGDRAITKQDQEKSKYILDVLGKAGIKPTVTSKTSGFFDEMNTTTNSYDIGTGKPITTTTQKYSPKIGGVAFGDDVTKTFVNGVATYTKTGEGEAKTSDLGSLKQRSQSSPDPIAEMKDIDNQIKTETDPVILKALHKRRLMLMRMNRTNTRFAGLLGEADTKRTNLMSIS